MIEEAKIAVHAIPSVVLSFASGLCFAVKYIPQIGAIQTAVIRNVMNSYHFYEPVPMQEPVVYRQEGYDLGFLFRQTITRNYRRSLSVVRAWAYSRICCNAHNVWYG